MVSVYNTAFLGDLLMTYTSVIDKFPCSFMIILKRVNINDCLHFNCSEYYQLKLNHVIGAMAFVNLHFNFDSLKPCVHFKILHI